MKPLIYSVAVLSTVAHLSCGDDSAENLATGGAPASGGDLGAGGEAGVVNGSGSSGSGGSLVGGTGSASAIEIPSGTFLADAEGYVIFEAEAIAGKTPPEPWIYSEAEHCVMKEGTMVCSAALDGGGYYKFGGATACGQTTNTDVGLMSLQFQIVKSGLYRMVWRNMRDHSGGCSDNVNNDSFVSFPTAKEEAGHRSPFKVYGGGDDSFYWNTTQGAPNESEDPFPETDQEAVCVTFDAGVHEMRISGRSNNHTIDRIAFVPTDGTLSFCQRDHYRYTLDVEDRPLTGQQP